MNEEREIAIRLSGVKKRYKLGQIGGGTLTEDIQSWWARVRGKEDPNTMIGTDQRLVGQTFMALNGIDLTVYKGEALGIIGCNGAGKSTLLKLLCRVTAPTEGEIDIYGRIASMLEVGTGFNGEMTGRENVYMNGAILGMTKAEIDEKMEDIIEFSEVRDFIDTPVKRYSSGMFVKLAFSVAAHLNSEIMIMDEVLAVGDMAFQKKCLNKMRQAAKQDGRTVLYVSHNMNTIRTLCDRCIVLDKGKIIFDGDVEEAIELYMQEETANNGWIEGQTEFRYTDAPPRSPYAAGEARIQRLRLTDKTLALYDTGEPIRFQLLVEAKRDFADLRLRIEVLFGGDTPVGAVPSLSLGAFRAGESRSFAVNFDAAGLTVGKYRVDLVLFELDEFGNSFDQELLLPAFRMEVQGMEDIVWNAKSWGHFRFRDAEVTAVEEPQWDA
ncbi:MAG: polysaccharide ABC transporter ATP-binding protein [Firmicutes bacterium]|nr:polysaccharide ABC transporter ATP-binding protein [Bacillota bacterium]